MANNVPSQYQGIVNEAVQGTHLPEGVVVAQINAESGFNPNAVSPSNAQGMFQFLPSTYTGLGFPAGSEFNPNEEVKAYIKYMDQLLNQEGGSVFKALEAYNAGPANLSAGAGYASSILSAAGQPVNIVAGGGSSGSGAGNGSTPTATLTSFPGGAADPLNWPGMLGQQTGQAITTGVASLGEAFLQALGIKSVKDLFIRGGLILFGAILVIVGLIKLFDMGKAAESSGAVVSLVAPEAGLGMMEAGKTVSHKGARGAAVHHANQRARKLTSQSPEGQRAANRPLTGASDADRQIEKSTKDLANA
jgi:Transglycosylase SLT domain